MDKQSKKERSRAYPAVTLEEALIRIVAFKENLGIKGQFNRESVAVGIGYSGLSGTAARTVAALTHYGLLDREKDTYSLSSLAKMYILPRGDSDAGDAIRTAALQPTLFAEIYTAFKGQVIPKQFTNRLVQDFGIQHKVAAEVDRIFRSSMATAGILMQNGILNAEQPIDKELPIDGDDVNDESITPEYGNAINNDVTKHLSVNLPSGLIVSYPQSLAPAFAFGEFGTTLRALDKAVSDYVTKNSVSGTDKELNVD